MSFWTIRRKFRSSVALALLVAAMQPALAQGPQQRHYADEVSRFSAVLDAGRALELAHRDDPKAATLRAQALDLAVRLNYDPLISRDAAAWYVRAAAAAFAADPERGERARALLAKLDAEEQDASRLAADADADATANAAAFPDDAGALVDQVDADLRAYAITKDPRYRSLALLRAAQPRFPIALVPPDTATPLWAVADEAQRHAAGTTDTDRAAARSMASHKISAKWLHLTGRVISHQEHLQMTAPADKYFGQTKLSPLGVGNEITRIGRYLDAGWGDKMTHDALWVVDALDDLQRQYPRDYEVPRLLLQSYRMLARIDAPDAQAAAARMRRLLTIEYEATPEARTLLAS
jgi:hypothetical protein